MEKEIILNAAVKQLPETPAIVYLESLLMPNGELLCNGRSLGTKPFEKDRKFLFQRAIKLQKRSK